MQPVATRLPYVPIINAAPSLFSTTPSTPSFPHGVGGNPESSKSPLPSTASRQNTFARLATPEKVSAKPIPQKSSVYTR